MPVVMVWLVSVAVETARQYHSHREDSAQTQPHIALQKLMDHTQYEYEQLKKDMHVLP